MRFIEFLKKEYKLLPLTKLDIFDLLLASFLINMLSLALPVTLMQVYDRILPNKALETLSWLVVACSAALLFEGVLRVSRALISGWMSAKFEHLMGCELIDKLLSSRLTEFEQDRVGTHLERIKSLGMLRGFYSGQIFQILLDLPFVILFIVGIWYLGGVLAFYVLAVIAIFLWLVYSTKERFEQYRYTELDITNKRFSFILELLSGIHTVNALAIEEQMLRRYETLQAKTAKVNIKTSFWGTLPVNLGSMFSNIIMFGIIIIGAEMVLRNELTIGALAASTMLGNRAMQPVQSLASFWLRFSDVKIARSQVERIRGMEPDTLEGVPQFTQDIDGSFEFQNVSFKYEDGKKYIFNSLNFKVESRQMVGVLASRGSRTLFYILLGLLKPESGRVLLDNYDIAKWDSSTFRGLVEYIPSESDVFKGSVLENIALFDINKYDASFDAATMVGLDSLVADLPLGYETVVDSQSKKLLPPGLLQRIAIARALVVRPRILIFDRIDMSMDLATKKMFKKLVSDLKGKCTIVLVSDSMDLVGLSDTVCALTSDSMVKIEGIGSSL